MSKITLQCVKDRSKLRIRFHSFTDEDGKVYTNVYDNRFNCKFPRNIREEGRFYEIGADDLSLAPGNGKPFYNVKFNRIKIVDASGVAMKPSRNTSSTSSRSTAPHEAPAVVDISTMKIFEVNECVACLGDAPSEVFIPCAHKCVCKSCCGEIRKHTNQCPLCRRRITSTISA